MLSQKSSVVSLLVIASAGLAACLILYSKNKLPGFHRNCLRLLSGHISIKLYYPDEFIDDSFESAIRIRRRSEVDRTKSANEEYVLMVDSPGYPPDTLNQILNHSEGPRYERSTFNGREAARAEGAYKNWSIIDYALTVGNRNVFISQQTSSSFSPKEIRLTEKMIDSIRISETNEEVGESRVEACD